MFKDNPNFKKIDDEIYVWEDFLTPDEQKFYFDLAESVTEEEWHAHYNPNEFWNGKASENKLPIYEIGNRINKILEPEYVVPPTGVITRTPLGQGMYVHKDRGEEGYEDMLNDFGTCTCIDYGALVYFGEWEGGELYYPQRNIEFKPKAGSLIIHSALDAYEHGVKPVTAGKRYLYTNFISGHEESYINPFTQERVTGAIYVDWKKKGSAYENFEFECKPTELNK